MPQLDEPFALDDDHVAGCFATSLLSMSEWVHRRVESITFTNADSVRRRVSVDFTPADYFARRGDTEDVAALVPLAYLKKGPVTSLDVRDASGGAVPVLITEENGTLAAAALRSLASATLQARYGVDAVIDTSALDALLERVVRDDPIAAADAFAEMKELLERARDDRDDLAALSDSSEFLEVVGTLVESFLLVAVVNVVNWQRCILKFSYISPLAGSDERSTWERFTDGVGFSAQTYALDAPGAALTQCFHVELEVPDGVVIAQGGLYREGEHMEVPPVAGASVLHLMAPRNAGPALQVKINLRVAQAGWLRTSLATVITVTALLIGCGLRLTVFDPAPFASPPSDAAAALLLGLAAVVAAVVVRPGEHGLTVRLLKWARVLTLTGVALPAVATYLIVFGPGGTALRVWWWVLTAVSAAIAVCLFFVHRPDKHVV